MFDNIPIQKRWRVILGIIAFAFGISLLYAWQVWGIYQKNQELEAKTAVIEDADLEIVNRQVRLKELSDQISGSQQQDSITTHVQLMQYIEAFCDQHQLQLIALPKENLQDIEGYQIATVEFAITGGYHDILALIYQLEAKDRIGSIARAAIELQTVHFDNGPHPLLVGSISLNRLLQSKTATSHEAS